MYDYGKNAEIKRKIRALKKLETKIRNECVPNLALYGSLYQHELLWNIYFNLNEEKGESKYSMPQLMRMSKEELKTVIDDFICLIFAHYYTAMSEQENSIHSKNGVPKSTQYEDVMRDMRELVKECHPDNGGDSEMFIKVLEKYRRIKRELDSKSYH